MFHLPRLPVPPNKSARKEAEKEGREGGFAIDKSAARCNERRKIADGNSASTEMHLKVAARLRDTAWLTGCVHTTYGPPFSAALKSIVLP